MKALRFRADTGGQPSPRARSRRGSRWSQWRFSPEALKASERIGPAVRGRNPHRLDGHGPSCRGRRGEPLINTTEAEPARQRGTPHRAAGPRRPSRRSEEHRLTDPCAARCRPGGHPHNVVHGPGHSVRQGDRMRGRGGGGGPVRPPPGRRTEGPARLPPERRRPPPRGPRRRRPARPRRDTVDQRVGRHLGLPEPDLPPRPSAPARLRPAVPPPRQGDVGPGRGVQLPHDARHVVLHGPGRGPGSAISRLARPWTTSRATSARAGTVGRRSRDGRGGGW